MTVTQLSPLENYKVISGPIVMVVMDGLGLGEDGEQNGVYAAHTPTLDGLFQEKLFTSLKAHGTAVGLPSDADMGNSEVGHNALGAGRIFVQGAKLIDEALSRGDVFSGAAWQKIVECGESAGTVHFIGLVSDGNVHSNISQLFQLLDACAEAGIERVRVHALLDGRDVAQKSALDYIRPLEERLRALSVSGRDYRIASGGGRMVTTMDRYKADWSVVERGWRAHVLGEGRFFSSASEAVETFYREDSTMTDQYMAAFVVVEGETPVGTIEDGDAVVCFNFRGDRAIEISRAFDEEVFQEFDRVRRPDVFYAGIMEYDGDAHIPRNYLVEPPLIDATLGDYLCASGVTSYAISETQKFGHMTYFWNGNKSGYIDEGLELYEEVLSDRVTFDQRPWMKAAEITDKVIEQIEAGERKFIRLNYPNADMVGHTGVPLAVEIAVEAVDLCLARLLPAVEKAGGIVVISADHGNADCMWTEKGGKRLPMVAHTLNPVPCIIKDFSGQNDFVLTDLAERGLANVAATLCLLLGFNPPTDYEPSLLKLK
ncbi:2,3-bisphosphoglycerate-independent phosphoglycerate mutase [Desulfotalea psychrophila]|uniref:2,3-bisphosphoglycerate-independent phosphoglycerate mutase n=1 Tax=Desulfotalea psychrophila (strain LSv54 / DSM 12343) TaxID=177439 RepID=Q6AKC4_DESPS|nr:2,3-bisphosphoglycerate-independent phosphoglycerate mutase [Desulfotalea psychrophila]CAG37201.1 probable 2,3-bisphosphoglycerate-independent phosphoglycerate mutase [Desulfotalea psychrophila LSv54]